MPAKITPEEKIRRGEAALHELRILAAEIIRGKYEGNERGAAYRHLNSLTLHVKHHVGSLKARRRKNYDERIARKAVGMCNEADELYQRAWKAHH